MKSKKMSKKQVSQLTNKRLMEENFERLFDYQRLNNILL